jgi:hypothetical protein
MDSKKRHKIVEAIKEMLDEGSFGSNEDFRRVLERAASSPLSVLCIDDEVSFDGDKCITECGGRCCFETELVRVTPVDAEYLSRSPELSNLSRAEIVDRYIQTFLGGDSLIPMGMLKKVRVGQYTICPFIDLRIREKYREEKVEKKMLGGICSVGQEYKPAICILYPLGRIEMPEGIEGLDEKSFFILSAPDCPAVRTGVRVPVREFVEPYRKRKAEMDIYRGRVIRAVTRLRREAGRSRAEELLGGLLDYFFKSEDPISEKADRLERLVEEEVSGSG